MIQDQIKSFWKFSELPFAVSLSTKEAFLPEKTLDTFDLLTYSVQQTGSICILNGPSGSGKSLLLRKLYDDFPNGRMEPILLNLMQPVEHSGWLANKIAENLDWDCREFGAVEKLMERLDSATESNRKLALLIDSSHWLTSPEAFTEISALLNLQSLANPCVSFVFSGIQMSKNFIKNAGSLTHRITMSGELHYMNFESIRAYVHYRTQLAGVEEPIFQDSAIRLIHQITEGNILKVDRLCSNALFKAFKLKSKEIKKQVIADAAQELPHLDFHPSAQTEEPSGSEKKKSQRAKREDGGEPANDHSFDSFLKDPSKKGRMKK